MRNNTFLFYTRFLIPIFIFILNFQITNAQWVKQSVNTGEKLNAVVMVDSATAFVAGSRTSIFKTSDCGKTWINVFPEIGCNSDSQDCIIRWNNLSFYDSLTGIAVGDDAAITTDGGKFWHFINIPEANELLCVSFLGPGIIYAGDDSGFVYRSADSGKTWKSEKITDLPIRSIFYELGVYISGALVYALTSHSLFSRRSTLLPDGRIWETKVISRVLVLKLSTEEFRI